MLIKNLKYLLLLIVLFNVSTSFGQQPDFDSVTNRVVKSLVGRGHNGKAEESVKKDLSALQPNGTWADINYTDNAVAIWSPALHLSRVHEFAAMYAGQDSKYNGDKTLYAAIVKALQAWNRIDPKCKNWWYNEISCPQALGQIMLLMQSSKTLPATLQDSLLIKMNRGDMYKQTGANKLDVALHNMYRALLTHNSQLMDAAIGQCFQPIVLTTDAEGLLYDYSYMQHGRQLQIASYGSVFLSGEQKIAAYVRDTKWQMPVEKAVILAKFKNDVYLRAIRGNYFDFSVMGRGFSRKDSGKAAVGSVIGQIKPVHQQFWIGDYTQHATPDFLFTVRTNSTRTKRLETGNGENLYGRYMSDGATDIQRSGDEYFNIFPVWENDKVPGVTCRNYPVDRPAINSWDQPGNTAFTGGVSDGVNGTATYTLDFDSVKAKKSWFFFGKQIICLGAGITSNAPENITTAVNQCWDRTAVIASPDKKAYWQDSIGYYFEPGAQTNYTNAIQKGTWKHINNSQPADTVSGKVFKLWIDHGTQPQGAGYAYAVLPGISAKEFASIKPFQQLQVVINNTQQQAVYDAKTGMLQAVYYQPGTIKAGNLSVAASAPCVLMIEKDQVFIADPTQQLKSVAITVNGKKIDCKLPENQFAGSTAMFSIK